MWSKAIARRTFVERKPQPRSFESWRAAWTVERNDWTRDEDPLCAAVVTWLKRRGCACDRWDAYRAIKKAAKVKKSWGRCPACKGHGETPESRKKANRWKPKEPPKGSGWQLWETTSEGSPVSPVFKTAEELASWCAERATAVAGVQCSRETWLRMFLKDETSAGTLGTIGADGPSCMANER